MGRTIDRFHFGTRIGHSPCRRQETMGTTIRLFFLFLLLLGQRRQCLLRLGLGLLQRAGRGRTIPTNPSIDQRRDEKKGERLTFAILAELRRDRPLISFDSLFSLDVRRSDGDFRGKCTQHDVLQHNDKDHFSLSRQSRRENERDHRWNDFRTKTRRLSSLGWSLSTRICVEWR